MAGRTVERFGRTFAVAATLVAAVVRCASPEDPTGGAEPGADAEGAEDARADAPVRGTDAAAELDAPRGVRLRLHDGGLVEGPLAAVYDHRHFWDASDSETYAVLAESAFAYYPADRSLRFVSSSEIATLERSSPAVPDPRFFTFTRVRGITLVRAPLDGVSLVIRGNDGYHVEEDGYGNYAWDFVRLHGDGARFTGAGTENQDYRVWDQPVYLPSGGEVVEVVRDGVDNSPGAYPPGAQNNLVGVHLGGTYYVYLLHFRQGTIPSSADGTCAPALPAVPCVEVGAQLPAGAYLGRAGNSGVTLEPHVHMTLLYYDLAHPPARTWSVPGEMKNVYVAGSRAGPATLQPFAVPTTGSFVSNEPF